MRLGFHKHYEKLHEPKLCTEKNKDSVQQNTVRPQRGRGKGPQKGEQSSPSVQTCNNPKKVVSPNVKIETEKPVTKPQPIEQKVKKDKSAASAPTDGSMRRRTTHDDVMEDSDPEFNCERLLMPGLESDNWFYQLGKEVQISFEKGKEKFIFVCQKCKRSCT